MIRIIKKEELSFPSFIVRDVKSGETFQLKDESLVMVAVRNGHPFLLDLATGKDIPWTQFSGKRVDLNVIVIERK